MRQSIGKGNVKSLLGSPCRQLNESICPNTGSTFRSSIKLYGAVTITPLYVDQPDQVWGVSGVYKLYSDQGPLSGLRPYGRWRISLHLEVLYAKVGAGDQRDILKCNLVRYRTDSQGNPTGAPDLIQKAGNQGAILEGIPDGATPTWMWDLTTGPFVFDDFIEVGEQDAYCFVAFDAIFSESDPTYISGTLAGIQPYGNGGNAINSDPLALYNGTGIIFKGPPPTLAGDWNLPLVPFLNGGAVSALVDGNTRHTIDDLDAKYPGWGDPRPTWKATITSQRLSLTALFNWKLTGASTVVFSNLTLTQGQIVSYLWNFGDGGTSAAANPAHAYPHSGVYTATLTATDTIGETSTFNQVVTVPLIAAFGWSGRNVVRGGLPVFEVTFVDASLGAATYDWDFGDATAHSTATNPIHSYPRGSSFTATLTITDAGANTSTVSHIITT